MTEDSELLSRYAADRSEAAFAELTARHVDLVYSTALRVVNGDVHDAEDVTQQVFTEAARQAKRLARHPALVGWFYTTTRHMALRANRTEQRRKAREQEANTMNTLLHDDSAEADWAQLRPVIEDVMHELDEKDRHAVLLRFFRNQSLKEVGTALGLNENAARMRVERALEKLRDKLARRGIRATAGALGAAVGVNAVHAAPAGFAATVSAAAIAGSAAEISAIVTATKAITMTTLQKAIVAAALTAAVGSGVYAFRQSSQMREQIQTLEQQKAPLTAQIRQLEQEQNETTAQLAALREETARLHSNQTSRELLKLRGEVGMLKQAALPNQSGGSAPTTGLAKMLSDPAMKEYIRKAQMDKIRSLYSDLFKELKLTPEQTEEVMNLLGDTAAKYMEQMTAPGAKTPEPAANDNANEFARRLQAVVGDAGLARFKEYRDEIPARTTLSLLKGQLEENSLNNEQSARLLQIVKAEPHELTQGITGSPDKAFTGSQTDIDSFLQRVTESNQRILQQAAAVLTQDQMAALDNVLSSAIRSRKLQAAALIQKH